MTRPIPPILTMAEAAGLAQMSVRQLRRWLSARAARFPDLLIREPGERLYYVKREALRAVLGLTDEDVLADVARHERMLAEHDRRLRALEHARG